MWRTRILCLALVVEAALLLDSCGARSGLLGLPLDAGIDSAAEATVDAGEDRDVGLDAPPDVSHDAPPDIPDVLDVKVDGLAPCDPNALFVYLVTKEEDLVRYDPGKGTFFNVGKLACAAVGTPYSMGVSRTGTAYVLYAQLAPANVGKVFAVSTEDASCEATPHVPGQKGFKLFGMGFAIDDDLMGETLYIAAEGDLGDGLASLDLESFEVTPIAPFSNNPGFRVELTSSDDGQLYGYALPQVGNGGHIIDIDKTTAEIVASTPVNAGNSNSAFAVAYWSQDFYIFTGPGGGPTTITRYRPADGTTTVVGTLPNTVVGAGVSTCSAR